MGELGDVGQERVELVAVDRSTGEPGPVDALGLVELAADLVEEGGRGRSGHAAPPAASTAASTAASAAARQGWHAPPVSPQTRACVRRATRSTRAARSSAASR